MLTIALFIQAVALGMTLAQERTFGNGVVGSGSFFGLGSTTTAGPIYQQIQGLAPNQHGYTLIDPEYARQYAQGIKRPDFNGNQNSQRSEYNKQAEAQDDFIRQVAEANKKRVSTPQEFRPSQALPPPPSEGQDVRFPSQNFQTIQSELGSEDFNRSPPPPPPQQVRTTFSFEQRPEIKRRPPPMATPPPPPTHPSIKNFPSFQFQPSTNPPLVIPELINQDLPELPPSLFADDSNNNFQRPPTRQPSAIRHPPRPMAPPRTQTLRGPPRFQPVTDQTFEPERNTVPEPVQKKRIQLVKKPAFSVKTPDSFNDNKDDSTAQFNEEIAKEQASHAQYAFQSSVQDSVNGQEQIRQETRDGLRLKGLYSYSDGFFKRTVYYEADENGYRVVKEESEPIGNGPQYDPDGKVDVESSFDGSEHGYSITGQQLEAAKKKNSFSKSQTV